MDIIGILVLVISFFFLLVAGVPVAYSIGVAGVLTMLVNIDSLPALTTYAMRMASGLDSFALLAIPFFILAQWLFPDFDHSSVCQLQNGRITSGEYNMLRFFN